MFGRSIRFGVVVLLVVLASSLAVTPTEAAGFGGRGASGGSSPGSMVTSALGEAWEWFAKALRSLTPGTPAFSTARPGPSGRARPGILVRPGQPRTPLIRIQCDAGQNLDPNGHCLPKP